MNGIAFLNPLFWPGLLALGIPLWIHLRTRRNVRFATLPTFQFLQRSLAQQSRIFRLRRWVLLALRLCLILFLVLAFLKPTLNAPLGRLSCEKRAMVIVLDASLSMGGSRGGVTAMERARGQCMALLDDLRSGDAANVILAGATPRVMLSQPSGDFGALRQTIKTAQPLYERGDIPAAVAAAAEQLEKTDAPHKELILAGDFQRTNWADVSLDSLPADTKLILLNADSENRENAGITGLHLKPAAPRAGEEAQVVAEVWNGSPTPRTLAVSLKIERDEATNHAPLDVAPQTVALPPYATGTVAFPVTFPDTVRYRCTATIPADGLPADDTRYLVADLRHTLTALLLTDSEMQSPNGAYFLKMALNPTPDVPGGIRVVSRRPAALTTTDLKTCDIVLCDAIETFPSDRLPLLANYLKGGGAVLFFLANVHAPGQIAALAKLAPDNAGVPFLPETYLDVRRQSKGYVTLSEARYDSPLLQLFKDPNVADLSKTHFMRFFLTGETNPRAELLLKFEDGTPAAARLNYGAGSLLLCNFSPAPQDSDLARQEFFPPLLHELVQGMKGKEGERREFYPGGLASLTLDKFSGDVRAIAPNGESEPVSVDKTSGGVIIERVARPGFHSLLADGQAVATIAVNPHPDESDLRAIEPRTLESRRSSKTSYVVEAGQAGSAAALDSLRHSKPLWPYCIVLALLFLLAEHFVATFGGRAKLAANERK